MGKISKIHIFVIKFVLNHSKSIPTNKNPFFGHQFFEKMDRKKFSMGKNFQNRYFRFKIRFDLFLIDSDQKIFRKSFNFSKNGYVPEKISTGKNVQNRYFRF